MLAGRQFCWKTRGTGLMMLLEAWSKLALVGLLASKLACKPSSSKGLACSSPLIFKHQYMLASKSS